MGKPNMKHTTLQSHLYKNHIGCIGDVIKVSSTLVDVECGVGQHYKHLYKCSKCNSMIIRYASHE